MVKYVIYPDFIFLIGIVNIERKSLSVKCIFSNIFQDIGYSIGNLISIKNN